MHMRACALAWLHTVMGHTGVMWSKYGQKQDIHRAMRTLALALALTSARDQVAAGRLMQPNL